jgi:hypothetical protein
MKNPILVVMVAGALAPAMAQADSAPGRGGLVLKGYKSDVQESVSRQNVTRRLEQMTGVKGWTVKFPSTTTMVHWTATSPEYSELAKAQWHTLGRDSKAGPLEEFSGSVNKWRDMGTKGVSVHFPNVMNFEGTTYEDKVTDWRKQAIGK